MNDREKLIELLSVKTCPNAICNFCEHFKNGSACEKHKKEVLADHLLANGVTFERSRAQWVLIKKWYSGKWHKWYECSCCGERDDNYEMYEAVPFAGGLSNFCHNCGADMRGEGDG